MPYILVFFASFCLMVMELVAGRIMAPTLGVSLYSWTSIISVILAGITAGNYIGGRIADRNASKLTLGAAFVVSGMTSLAIVYMARFMETLLASGGMSLWISTLEYSLFVFFAPAFFLSVITPTVVKLTLQDLAQTGSTVGRIYAWSAFGSIVGTMVTGFFLINFLGTKIITIGVAVSLFATGVILMGNARFWKHRKAPIGVMVVLAALALPNTCTLESQYYCIRVINSAYAGFENVRVLKLDHLTHSFLLPDEQTGVKAFGYDYEKLFALLVAMEQKLSDPWKALFIGGGGYVGPRYFEKLYPRSGLEVLEIDPAVTEINYDRLELARSTRIHTTNGDARMSLKLLPPEQRYDYIFGDAFNDLSIPYHLTTHEFNQLVKSHLTDHGWYALNVIDEPTSGRFVSSVVRTLQQSFKNVYLLPGRSNWRERGRSTFVVFATDGTLDSTTWQSATLPTDIRGFSMGNSLDSPDLKQIAPSEEVDQYIQQSRGMVLTDDFVPVDKMLTPVLIKRTDMHLIVGLGNPGEEYEQTRHNAGFLAVDKLAEHLNLSWKLQKKQQTEVARTQHVILAKPQTFMNLSGVSVRSILSNLNCQISNVIVVHDEIDLEFGTIRVSHGSSAAGHRGVQSVIDHLGTKDFWRIRIGIRPTRISNIEYLTSTPEFVLKPFSKQEQKRLSAILEMAVTLITEMIDGKATVKTVHVK